jgi:hypothetical protein
MKRRPVGGLVAGVGERPPRGQGPERESLAKRYEMIEPIGPGGMGAVFRVRDKKLGREGQRGMF